MEEEIDRETKDFYRARIASLEQENTALRKQEFKYQRWKGLKKGRNEKVMHLQTEVGLLQKEVIRLKRCLDDYERATKSFKKNDPITLFNDDELLADLKRRLEDK